MKKIIGSNALNFWFPSVFRTPKDLDFFVPESHKHLVKDIGDGHVIPDELYNVLKSTKLDGYVTPDHLLSLKLSHIEWDIFWFKHIRDIVALKYLGFKPDENVVKAFKDYWKKTKGYKTRLSLMKDKEDFFNDAVVKTYDHDWLHEVVAHPDVPMYTKCVDDGQEVMISKEKFMKLDKSQQLRMFLEEIMVISLERWVIPSNFKIHPFIAYKWALQKTVTNLTKNWASEFIIDNIEFYWNNDDFTYVENLLNMTGGDFEMIKKSNEIVKEIQKNILNKILSQHGMLWGVDKDEFWYTFVVDGRYQPVYDCHFKFLEHRLDNETNVTKVYFSINNITFQACFRYNSNGCTDHYGFSDWKVVQPVTKTITVYEPKEELNV
jgi:hypothetical protein